MNKIIGNNIKYYRKLNDITLRNLALNVGLTEATMQKYEAGKIKHLDLNLILKIAKCLDVEPQTLWTETHTVSENDTPKVNVGEILKSLRQEHGMSVRDVSDYMINKGYKASTKTIYSWENGNSEPSASQYITLCQLYNDDSFPDTCNQLSMEDKQLFLECMEFLKYKYNLL